MASQRKRGLLITFDAFDTLLKARRDVPRQYLDIARTFKIRRTHMQVCEAFPIALKAQMERYPNYGKGTGMSVEHWWKMVAQNTFFPTYSSQKSPPRDMGVLPVAMFSKLFKRFASKSGYMKFTEVNKLIWNLKDPEYLARRLPGWDLVRTGVISNSDLRCKLVLDDHKISKYLDFQVYSYTVDCEKPDKEIFDIAKKMGTKDYPDYDWTCLHIGDKFIEDYMGATMAGWKALHLTRELSNPFIPKNHNLKSLKLLFPYAQELAEKLDAGKDIYNDPEELVDHFVKIETEEEIEAKIRAKKEAREKARQDWAEKNAAKEAKLLDARARKLEKIDAIASAAEDAEDAEDAEEEQDEENDSDKENEDLDSESDSDEELEKKMDVEARIIRDKAEESVKRTEADEAYEKELARFKAEQEKKGGDEVIYKNSKKEIYGKRRYRRGRD